MTPSQWMTLLTPPFAADARRPLTALYGADPAVWRARAELLCRALACYREWFGEGDVQLVRAPARVSLNPHADHQGCFVLYGCHARELVAVAGARDDRRFVVANADPQYETPLSFSLDAERDRDSAAWERGWPDYIEAPAVKAEVAQRVGARTRPLNYIKAAVLRLAAAGDARCGLNLALAGDIPPAAGQSSSSALVVATALALQACGWPRRQRSELAALLGEAEWYVGTRGGSGDHAAMLLGERGELTNIRFEPPVGIREVRTATFPSGYRLWLVNSGVRAEKSSAEKRLFNRGVFAYKFALRALQAALGPTGEEISRLADVSVERFALGAIYDLLLALPEEARLAELKRRWPHGFDALCESFFDTADPTLLPASVPLRGAALYGLGRADRGLVQDRLLTRGTPEALAQFGELMSVTHDGDRLFRGGQPWRGNLDSLSNEALLASRELPLRLQSGFYGASIAALDAIVDTVQALPGVLGSGLMGAGGGGVVLVLARDEPGFEAALRAQLPDLALEPFTPVAGARAIAAR